MPEQMPASGRSCPSALLRKGCQLQVGRVEVPVFSLSLAASSRKRLPIQLGRVGVEAERSHYSNRFEFDPGHERADSSRTLFNFDFEDGVFN